MTAIPASWSVVWVETLDVETRTDENYRSYLRNHILPRLGYTTLGDITAIDVSAWQKDLRKRYAASSVAGIPAAHHQHPGQHHVHPKALPRYAPPENAAAAINHSSPCPTAPE